MTGPIPPSEQQSANQPGNQPASVTPALDAQAREFAATFRRLTEWAHRVAGTQDGNEVSRLVRDYLGADGVAHSVVTRDLPPFEHVNLQTALDAWLARDGRTADIQGIAMPRTTGA